MLGSAAARRLPLPVAVIAKTWLNLEMVALANLSHTALQCFDERLKKLVKHKPVQEKPK